MVVLRKVSSTINVFCKTETILNGLNYNTKFISVSPFICFAGDVAILYVLFWIVLSLIPYWGYFICSPAVVRFFHFFNPVKFSCRPLLSYWPHMWWMGSINSTREEWFHVIRRTPGISKLCVEMYVWTKAYLMALHVLRKAPNHHINLPEDGNEYPSPAAAGPYNIEVWK